MAKPEARQYTFLTLVPVLSQEGTEPSKKHRRKKNPDREAVITFMKQESTVIYEGGAKPPNHLTDKQRRMYYAIKTSEAEWRKRVGEDGYVAADRMILDQNIPLAATCFECGTSLLQENILVKKGAGESLIQRETWCPSCGNPQSQQTTVANHLIEWGKKQ